MSDLLFSFVIPAYNAASTLNSCVESICSGNSNSKYEVLVVENGSSDNTTDQAESLRENYPEIIRVFHSEKGVSRARNLGIREARGKYIIFIDADDQMLPDAMTIMVKDSEKNYDLTLYGYHKGNELISLTNNKQVFSELIQIEKARVWMLSKPTLRMTTWAKMYKRETILKMESYFDVDMAFSEDSDFLIRFTKECKTICISNESIYQYILSPTSTMRSYNPKRIEAYIKAMEKTADYEGKESLLIRLALQKYILQHLNIVLVRNVFSKDIHETDQWRTGIMKDLLQKPVFAQALRKIPLSECTELFLLPEFFFKLGLTNLGGKICAKKAEMNYKKENGNR